MLEGVWHGMLEPKQGKVGVHVSGGEWPRMGTQSLSKIRRPSPLGREWWWKWEIDYKGIAPLKIMEARFLTVTDKARKLD